MVLYYFNIKIDFMGILVRLNGYFDIIYPIQIEKWKNRGGVSLKNNPEENLKKS